MKNEIVFDDGFLRIEKVKSKFFFCFIGCYGWLSHDIGGHLIKKLNENSIYGYHVLDLIIRKKLEV